MIKADSNIIKVEAEMHAKAATDLSHVQNGLAVAYAEGYRAGFKAARKAALLECHKILADGGE